MNKRKFCPSLILILFFTSSLISQVHLDNFNVALNKKTNQSSTYSNSNDYTLSKYAVDGVKENHYLASSKTKKENEPWWEVDLNFEYDLEEIKIIVNKVIPPEGDLYIILSDRPITNNLKTSSINKPGTIVIKDKYSIPNDYILINCSGKRARYVRVFTTYTNPKKHTLTLPEVEIMVKGYESKAAIFLNKHKSVSFSDDFLNTMRDFIDIRKKINLKKFDEARTIMSKIWTRTPLGSYKWTELSNLSKNNNLNLGDPPFYASLRMLDDFLKYEKNNPNKVTKDYIMSVLVVKKSTAKNSCKIDDYKINNSTNIATKNIDNSLLENDFEMLKKSLENFKTYFPALTNGVFNLKIEYYEIDYTVPLNLSFNKTNKTYSLGIKGGGLQNLIDSIDKDVNNKTDIWTIYYPSGRRSNYPIENSCETSNYKVTTTGGITSDNKRRSIIFADDKFITHNPPTNKSSGIAYEKNSYFQIFSAMPQFYQHEIYHRLLRVYPNIIIDLPMHAYQNPINWPKEWPNKSEELIQYNKFWEPDFYHEALYKILFKQDFKISSELNIHNWTEIEKGKFIYNEYLGVYKDAIRGFYAALNNVNGKLEFKFLNNANKFYFSKNPISRNKLAFLKKNAWIGKEMNFEKKLIDGIEQHTLNTDKKFKYVKIVKDHFLGNYVDKKRNNTSNIFKKVNNNYIFILDPANSNREFKLKRNSQNNNRFDVIGRPTYTNWFPNYLEIRRTFILGKLNYILTSDKDFTYTKIE